MYLHENSYQITNCAENIWDAQANCSSLAAITHSITQLLQPVLRLKTVHVNCKALKIANSFYRLNSDGLLMLNQQCQSTKAARVVKMTVDVIRHEEEARLI